MTGIQDFLRKIVPNSCNFYILITSAFASDLLHVFIVDICVRASCLLVQHVTVVYAHVVLSGCMFFMFFNAWIDTALFESVPPGWDRVIQMRFLLTVSMDNQKMRKPVWLRKSLVFERCKISLLMCLMRDKKDVGFSRKKYVCVLFCVLVLSAFSSLVLFG